MGRGTTLKSLSSCTLFSSPKCTFGFLLLTFRQSCLRNWTCSHTNAFERLGMHAGIHDDMCRFGSYPTPSTFSHFFCTRLISKQGWVSLISMEGKWLFKPFATFFKRFQAKYFKLVIKEVGRSKFFDKADTPSSSCIGLRAFERWPLGLSSPWLQLILTRLVKIDFFFEWIFL